MRLIERDIDRDSLPLVVIPNCTPTLAAFFEKEIDRFAGIARVRMYVDGHDVTDENTILERAQGADALIVLAFHVSDSLFDALSGTVRCYAFGGTGVANYVNVPKAKERGVRICNARHYGDQSVAEHAIALMFELTKHTGRMNDLMHADGGWPGCDAMQLSGMTLGIAGFGGIGRATARMGVGLGMNVIEWSRHPHEQEAAALGVRSVPTLEDLFEQSDIVSLHITLNGETKGIITRDLLDRLHPGAMLINTARSQLIEDGALLDRLSRGDIAAGLDVFDTEPLPDGDPLRSQPHAVITPHNAWRTDAAIRGIAEQCVQAVVSWIQGGDYNAVV